MNLLRVSSLTKRSLLGWSPDPKQSLALHTVTCFFRFQRRNFEKKLLFFFFCDSAVLLVTHCGLCQYCGDRGDLRVGDVWAKMLCSAQGFLSVHEFWEGQLTYFQSLLGRGSFNGDCGSQQHGSGYAIVCPVTKQNLPNKAAAIPQPLSPLSLSLSLSLSLFLFLFL